MNLTKSISVLSSSIILSITLTAHAETYEQPEGVYIKMGAGIYDPITPKDILWKDDRGVTNKLRDSYHGELGLGYRLSSRWAVELNWLRTPFGAEEGHHDFTQGRGDLLFNVLKAGNFSPYLKAGLGHEIVKLKDAVGDRGTMWTAGLGADYLFSDNFFVRAEARYAKSWEEEYEHIVYTLGMGYSFGSNDTSYDLASVQEIEDEAQDEVDTLEEQINQLPPTAAAPIIIDSDNDGVEDSLDICDNTQTNLKVDEKGCAVFEETLPKIAFENNSSVLTEKSHVTIKAMAKSFKQYSNLKVEVRAYTDSVGKNSYNQWLSQRRADAVKQALIDEGVDASILSSAGYGELHPIADNATKEGRAKNRRVEVSVSQ